MGPWLTALGAALALYGGFLLCLLACGRREDARAWGGLVPDCLVLVRRLLADGRTSRGDRILLVALVGYLALPIDLVPDVIPVAGQLDDAILVALVLRRIVRRGGPERVHALWPGPPSTGEMVLRLAGAGPGGRAGRARPRPGAGCVALPSDACDTATDSGGESPP